MLIGEYCGGGYGRKGTGTVTDIIPALLAKKTGTPVQMRISREEEHCHRRRASRAARPDESRVHQGRPHHRDRHVHGGRRRAVRPGRRRQLGRPLRVADVSARGDAVARRDRYYQHTATPCAEPARRHAGHRADGSRDRQSGTQARDRSGRDPEDQRAGRQSASSVRPTRRATGRTTTSCFLKETLDKGARDLQVGRTKGPQRPARRDESARQRRRDQLV